MRITRIETIVVGNPWKNWLFLRVFTDAGITGLGEATSGLATKPIEAAVAELEPLYLGLDPLNVREARQVLSKGIYLDTSAAIAGIEMACWDILGKSTGLPVWQLLGGRVRRSIPAYANGWYSGGRTPEAFARSAEQVVASGYRALKFDPFGDAYRVLSRSEQRLSLAIVEAVRCEVGDDVELMIEAHDRFDVDTAITVGRQLEPFGIRWYEAPVLSVDPDALRRVCEHVAVPVAAGERYSRPSEYLPLIEAGVRVIQPEVLNSGLIAAVEIAALAEAHQLPVAPHNAQSPLSTVVNLHLAAIAPNVIVQEQFDAFGPDWSRGLLTGTAALENGELVVPDGPGFGVELDEAVAARHPYSSRNFMRLFAPGWERREGDRPQEPSKEPLPIPTSEES